MTRDYITDMAEAIEKAVPPSGDFVCAVLGQQLAARLAESDPDLLSGWLHTRASVILAETIGDHLRRQRSTARMRGAARSFAEASAAFAAGDATGISHFAVEYVIDDGNTRRRVAEMTGADHAYVAAGYRRSAATSLMLEAFHRAVAERVGNRRTADVFTDEQYARMYESMTGGSD